MKSLLSFLSFLFFQYILAQDVLYDTLHKEKYIYLGEINNDIVKVLHNDKSMWADKNNLVFNEKLNSKTFLSNIFDSGLILEAEGDEPFWLLHIYKNYIVFTEPVEGKEKKISINTVYNNEDIDHSFAAMFYNKKNEIFGLIKSKEGSLEDYNNCDLCISVNSVYEIYFSINNNVYKGCLRIINDTQ